ncbi:MAG: DNA helicase RecQ [Deltaproteobacteria bacterium]|nr:DNA helicase RecQ [Deltaproteobacteria bacterium]
MIQQAEEILKNIFGYRTFRPLQREIIANLLHRRDTLVVMPTGGGKSLCYQIPAQIFTGLTLVVSPLISLMKDQVEQLRAFGVEAAVLNSTLAAEEYRRNTALVTSGEARLLYLAPETLLMPRTLELLAGIRVDCLTIDEAHCISEWGHDFRPEYRQLAAVRTRFPQAVCAALTATATPRVQEDIRACLRFEASNTFIDSFDRKNLFLQIVPKSDPFRQTRHFLKRFPDQSGIVYCTARRQVDELAERLAAAGYSVRPYHAGLADEERRCNQELFIRDDIQIMVATIAFGMGINKPNIRFVLHHDLPMNIESYYQQIGRAGRDGLPAHCLLLFSYGDIRKIRFFIGQKAEPEQRVADIHLNALIGFAETEECRRGPLLRYFGEKPAAAACGACDNCTNGKKAPDDITIPVQKFLSCVRRTGERFGAGHVIDVLRGSQGQRVVQLGHDRLSTYGIGTELSKKEWFFLSRVCLQKGLLAQDPEHGGLRLTPEAWEVMRGRQNVAGRLWEEREDPGSRGPERRDFDEELFGELRILRKELADALEIPPYAVFPDRTLMEMAAYLPQTEEGLLHLHGVGRVKLDRFGRDFLDTIREFCALHGTGQAVATAPAPAPDKRPASGRARGPRHLEIAVRFNEGTSVARLAEEYQVKETTILAHLHKALVQGFPLDKQTPLPELPHLSETQRTAVKEAFQRLGTERLGPLFAALNREIAYDDLHLLRLRYLLGV